MAYIHRYDPDNPRDVPDRVWMEVPELDVNDARNAAAVARTYATRLAPKLSGASARRIQDFYGEGWFGLRWVHSRLWFQEMGIRPFTMRSLAGKTIPMWVDDPSGETRRDNPNAETRRTEDGRIQVLIFRKAAEHGQRKRVRRGDTWVDVPASYPGAPGRIRVRDERGRIAPGNVGVRWRHPGMGSKGFLHDAMLLAAKEARVRPRPVIASNERWADIGTARAGG